MEVSARNQLDGTVKQITLGGVMAEVIIDIGNDQEIDAAVTRVSVENMGLKEGSKVVAIIKATEVLVGTR